MQPILVRKHLKKRTGILLLTITTLLILSSLSFPFLSRQNAHAANAQLGLNLDINEQALVDAAGYSARIDAANTMPLAADNNGWPSSDFRYIIDNRYTFGWVSDAVNIDPLKKSTDLSGTWKLSFNGQASIADVCDDPAHCATTISNQQYNAATNTTTADVQVGNPAGGVLIILTFTQTKRDASAANGSGVTNLHFWRPGYTPNTNQIFTDEWLSTLLNHNWAAFRFMSILETNGYGDPATDQKPYNELYPYRLKWSDRVLPNAGPLQDLKHPGVHGIPWEYVILIAQLTHKDIWINVPVNASDDYVNQLAALLKNGNAFTGNQGIPADINLYVEYSNEMWHFGFFQGPWNNQAAKDEVAAGNSNLNYDGETNDYKLLQRRIAKRTVEIGNQFKTAFGNNSSHVRPVVANASIEYNDDVLTYIQNNYGTVSDSIYGIATAGYYSSADKSSADAIIAGEIAASNKNKVDVYEKNRATANKFNVKSLVYEGGQDEQGNPKAPSPLDTGLANQFAAARDPRMQEVEVNEIVNNWFGSGGDLYMQFGHVGRFSTYGMWGLSDDVNNQTSGKWKGVDQVLGTTPTPTPTPTQTATPTPTGTPPVTGETVALSDLNWVTATAGYGSVKKNTSTDGNPLKLRDTTYPKGIGTHATSEITYNLTGTYKVFESDIGIDDEAWSNGSVIFQVYGDGVKLYESGIVRRDDAVQHITVNITGINELKLIVGDAGDGINSDHADWAGAVVKK